MRLAILTLAAAVPVLSACETSSRLPPLGSPFGGSERLAPADPRIAAAPRIETAPTARIESAPLAPPPGAELPQPQLPDGVDAGLTPAPQAPQTTTPPPAPQQAARPPEPDPAPTRSSVTGNWSLREAAGSCRVTLSSSPKLDLYGASTSGCQSRDLQRVTAWELRGDEVYLYEPGGGVTARLKARGQSMSGAIAKTGAPISLSK